MLFACLLYIFPVYTLGNDSLTVDTMVSKLIFTPPLKTNMLFPISYSKFRYPYTQTHLFESNFHSLPSTLSPRKLSPPPLNFCSSEALFMKAWIDFAYLCQSFTLSLRLSPEAFSYIEVLLKTHVKCCSKTQTQSVGDLCLYSKMVSPF